ncbi:hypothetical protein Cni_G11674 [Canna indica]|uniref:S-adenosyl-L-methionine-dependent methyltransferase n=1 Tax=Canna indica TaxID=4628 RepID=A0AAQ3QBY9_9LILI|nr:hypothetical protein Cni_G11674 [Canna indica]
MNSTLIVCPQIGPMLMMNSSTILLPSPKFPNPMLRLPPSKTKQCGFRWQSTRTPKPNLAEVPTDDDGIPIEHVKTLAKFNSRHNCIRVLDVSRRADHPLAGSRLLLLDRPGNIHSISFLLKTLTTTYFDVFATLPPLLPPGGGPIGVLGFGAGSAARLILSLYPDDAAPVREIHGWELDPSVIAVAREFFGLTKLERQHRGRLLVYIGDALEAEVEGGFAGILVDLFSKGSVIPELQDPKTWKKLRSRLRVGGRIMVNCGGRCVEAEDPRRDGDVVRKETLRAMEQVFADQVFVLNLGGLGRKEDSCLALTGTMPDLDAWKRALPVAELRRYVDMWVPVKDELRQ